MRLWSIHPKYLDAKGLVALWRESLLAKHVLEGKTKGYKSHPQLLRFKNTSSPADAINHYLKEIYAEAQRRSYNFDLQKILPECPECKLTVTTGQIIFEQQHLLRKLKERDVTRWNKLGKIFLFDPHPMFTLIEGDIENWEIF